MHINVIGAGLAGCEAAMQIASHGIEVHLYEMKPNKKTGKGQCHLDRIVQV